MTDPEGRARELKRKHEGRWLALKGVVAVGLARGEDGAPRIGVAVERDTEGIRRRIPACVDGIPVEIRLTGPMGAL
jgi:hypothetical protein